MQIPEAFGLGKIMNEPDKDIYNLGDEVYAVQFPYAIVTDMTLNMAIPNWVGETMATEKMQAKFAGETKGTAGTKRADSKEIAGCFPAENAMLQGFLEHKKLKDYVMFRLEAY